MHENVGGVDWGRTEPGSAAIPDSGQDVFRELEGCIPEVFIIHNNIKRVSLKTLHLYCILFPSMWKGMETGIAETLGGCARGEEGAIPENDRMANEWEAAAS